MKINKKARLTLIAASVFSGALGSAHARTQPHTPDYILTITAEESDSVKATHKNLVRYLDTKTIDGAIADEGSEIASGYSLYLRKTDEFYGVIRSTQSGTTIDGKIMNGYLVTGSGDARDFDLYIEHIRDGKQCSYSDRIDLHTANIDVCGVSVVSEISK
ncbi:hypothetical protein QTV49_004598 [Vibrio vulnificus]|nr:hypothetical protein [Vibrio vulnificus]